MMDDIGTESLEREFGWDCFTVEPASIKYYLASSIASQYAYSGCDLSQLQQIMLRTLGVISSPDWDDENYGYVDHQSLICIPKEYNRNTPSEQFIKDLFSYFQENNVGILGGNDNDEEDHHLLSKYPKLDHNLVIEKFNLTCRYDGNQWTLFDPRTGNRFRIRFNDLPIVRPDGPELVDLKITQFCNAPYPCGYYCYQGSNRDGKHGDTGRICEILEELSDLKVFEVAIGGGEATDHPDFMRICEYAKSLGITPNLTTRNKKFVIENAKWCGENLGRIAVSVSNEYDTMRLVNIKSALDVMDFSPKFAAQVVMGTVNESSFDGMIKSLEGECIPLTMLGFKDQEAGVSYRKVNYDFWVDVIKKYSPYTRNNLIGCDTKFISLHEPQLRELMGANADKYLSKKEGEYSCYIDAVENTISPSSFCGRNLYLVLSNVRQQWKDMAAI